MKLLRICALFKLPDDFNGSHEDAVKLFADYFASAPQRSDPLLIPTTNVIAAWSDAWPGFLDSPLRLRSLQDCLELQDGGWKQMPTVSEVKS